MKNLLILFLFGSLLLIGCQSEQKHTSTAKNNAKNVVAASVATSNPAPAAAPAPVATAPEVDMEDMATDKEGSDEAPALPENIETAAKSVKNTMNKSDLAPEVKMKKDQLEKDIMVKKENMEAKMAAEKEKMAKEAADMKAEKMKMAEEKAAEIKAAAEQKINDTKNNIKENTVGVKENMEEKIKETVKVAAFSHQIFDELLRKHVSSTGKVNYSGFKQDHAKLKSYLTQLEGQKVESGWSNDKKLAYWINAYNAYTVDMIVRNYPIKSITDLEGGKPWDKKFINLNGKTLSLNNIENDIIRPTFKDARIHFAVNCAAKSCPPLMNKAWTEQNLQSELDKRTRSFINNTSYNTITDGSAKISKIFEWYGEDFGNLNDYLAKYSKTKVDGSTKISYNEYDWSLNQ